MVLGEFSQFFVGKNWQNVICFFTDAARSLSLKCLTLAIQPGLAKILALDFEEQKGATPRLNKDWRWEEGGSATCAFYMFKFDHPGRQW
jgi:hypothetical protein